MPRIKKSTLALIEAASAPGGITIADVMQTRRCRMGEAIQAIHEAEATGRIVRSGGGPSTAFRWSAPTLTTPGASE